MYKLKLVETEKEFFRLKNKWNYLVNKTRSSYFLSWEWLYSWWHVYKENKKLTIVLIYNGKNLVGISPTYQSKGLVFNHIRFLGDNEVDSNYLDFIILKEHRKKAIEALINYFSKNILVLKYIDQESDLFNFYPNQENYKVSECPGIRLPSSIELFLSNLSSKQRYNLVKSERKISRKFRIEVKETELEKSFDIIKNINSIRWEDSIGKFSDTQLGFLEKLSRTDKKNIRSLVLYINNIPAAYNLNIINKDTIYVYSSAYKKSITDSEKYSFGTYLLYHNIKRAIISKKTYLDMLRGGQEYKEKISNSNRINKVLIIKTRKIHFIYSMPAAYLNKASFFARKKIPNKFQNKIQKIIPKKILNVIK